jgi:hypothetical protein
MKTAHIQSVPGGKDNILGGHSIGNSKQKLYMNMCPIPNGFRDRAILVVWIGRRELSFPPALLWEGRSIFWEVIVSVILRKNFIRMCVLFRTVSEIEPFDSIEVWLGVPVLSIPPALLCYVSTHRAQTRKPFVIVHIFV